MTLTATLKDQSVWLRSGDFACEIDAHFPITGGGFNILGLYLNDRRQFGSHFSVYMIKLMEANLLAEIYIHGNKTGSNGCCVWRDLEYGIRESEAYCRATADMRNPLSTEGIPTGVYGEIAVEYILKANTTEVIRRDTIRTEQPLYHLELQHFCQIPKHLKTEGLLHHTLSDGTDAAVWQSSAKAIITSNEDAFIGAEALRITVPSNSKGISVFKSLPAAHCADDKILCLAIKSKKETDIGEALQFFIENDHKRYVVALDAA
jgi:hypothetical protein